MLVCILAAECSMQARPISIQLAYVLQTTGLEWSAKSAKLSFGRDRTKLPSSFEVIAASQSSSMMMSQYLKAERTLCKVRETRLPCSTLPGNSRLTLLAFLKPIFSNNFPCLTYLIIAPLLWQATRAFIVMSKIASLAPLLPNPTSQDTSSLCMVRRPKWLVGENYKPIRGTSSDIDRHAQHAKRARSNSTLGYLLMRVLQATRKMLSRIFKVSKWGKATPATKTARTFPICFLGSTNSNGPASSMVTVS